MKVNNQSNYERFILTDEDTVVGRAIHLDSGRWAAYDLQGRERLTISTISFETPEDVASFFTLMLKGTEG